MFGHFGLLITPVQLTTLSDVPFDHPTNPGPIYLPKHATAAQLAASCNVWFKARYTFELSQAVEKTCSTY